MPRRLEIDEDLFLKAEQHCPKYLSTTGFINLIIDQGLTGCANVAAYSVGAGERFNVHQKLPLQFPPDLEVTTSEASADVASTDTDSQNSLMGRGLVKGGSGGKEERGATNQKDLKPIPPSLQQHETLIREFWRCKKGSRNPRAWSLLLTELDKIQDKFGNDRTKEQLMLAINGLWKGITFTNMQRFEPAKKPWQQEPEMKHPAHRDFTAERIAAERESTENFLGF